MSFQCRHPLSCTYLSLLAPIPTNQETRHTTRTTRNVIKIIVVHFEQHPLQDVGVSPHSHSPFFIQAYIGASPSNRPPRARRLIALAAINAFVALVCRRLPMPNEAPYLLAIVN